MDAPAARTGPASVGRRRFARDDLLLATLVLATGLAWSQVGRTLVSLPELLSAPLYAVAKIPIYVKLFTARQRQWIRTRRDGDR